jgi:outer membrane protein assembly factor BamB
MKHFLLTPAFLLTMTLVPAQDWPQYNGPQHDRVAATQVDLKAWPEAGPSQLWKVDTPAGFSSFTVAHGRAFTLVTQKGAETCLALDASSGKELWSTKLGGIKYDGGGDAGTSNNRGGDGPRSTPAATESRVFAYDASMHLTCLDAKSGKKLWSKDIEQQYKGKNIRWQNATSPLLEGNLVIVAGGGPRQSLLAFQQKNGKLAWRAEDEKLTHATPVAATLHGVRQVIFFMQSGLVAVTPEKGKVLWRAEYPFNISTAASPVVHGDLIYCSAGYGVGGGAFRVDKKGSKFEAELVWQQRNRLQNHWSTPICKDGYLYGMFSFKKYGEGPLKCVELSSGEEKWSVSGFGPGNVILVGDRLVALSDAGEVVLVDPSPEAYRELSRMDVLDGKCWSSPSFAQGHLFVRSSTEGVCLDLAAASDRELMPEE